MMSEKSDAEYMKRLEAKVEALEAEADWLREDVVDCAEKNERLLDETIADGKTIVRLEAIVAKLPKTADSVPVVPGVDVVWIDTGVGLRQSEVIDRHWASFGDRWGCCRPRRIQECSSTREAAKAAEGK